MQKNLYNNQDMFDDNWGFDSNSYKKFEIHEIKFYVQRAFEIKEYLNAQLKKIFNENINAEVYFNKAFPEYEDDEVITCLYENNFKIIISDTEMMWNCDFSLPLSITDEEVLKIAIEKLNCCKI